MLELRHVHTRYGKVECLKGISFTVKKGEIVALLGANGAGKTTVLKTISGLIRPTAGDVLFGGQAVSTWSPEAIVRGGLAHVPEGRQIFQRLDVRENLLLGAYARNLDGAALTADFQEIFKLFPVLQKRIAQKAGTLSGGEQQMLALGRALMSKPSFLLLDEPSLGLAPILVSAIFKMIRSIRERGVTILLVEQNARMALDTADRAYVMEVGEIVLEGAAAAIRENPAVKSAYLGG